MVCRQLRTSDVPQPAYTHAGASTHAIPGGDAACARREPTQARRKRGFETQALQGWARCAAVHKGGP